MLSWIQDVKTQIMEQVIIDGQTYLKKDDRITQDHFTEEYIVKADSVKIETKVELTREGYAGASSSSSYFVTPRTLENKLGNGIIRLITRYGNLYLDANYSNTSNGAIYRSAERNNRVDYYDAYTHPRMNVTNKFRAFNNIIKRFKDVNNRLIPDTDRKALIHRNFEFGTDSLTYKLLEGLDYTFGVELETSSGRLNEEDVEGLNLMCEFDGSLRDTPDQRKEDVLGGEYVTGVLKGDAGMFQLQKVCNKLAEKCTINSKCGVHVHVGGIKFTKENLVYMYMLGELVQDEAYAMLPTSRRKNAYCRKLKSLGMSLENLSKVNTSLGYEILIDEYFNKIFKEVSHGKSPDKNTNKKFNHPMGSKCGYDKATQRYCWLNFVTCMFNTKGSPEAMTLEFRSHSATLNYSKVKNWVKICMAFVSFVENNKASIKRGYWLDKDKTEYPINLSTIVKAVYPKTHKLLINYIDNRKQKFFYDDGAIEAEEYKTDKDGIKFLTLKEDITCAL